MLNVCIHDLKKYSTLFNIQKIIQKIDKLIRVELVQRYILVKVEINNNTWYFINFNKGHICVQF